ncbi:MAG: Na+:solute symporter [Phycisphaerales bacterium]|nr:MAG: Na+:solute symporter [Phycisphaerales bacterium]
MGIPLHGIDIAIIVSYIVAIILMGWFLSKRASQNLDAYFLAGKSLPWWVIGTSHGASGFDITGTMWFVAMLFTYGVKAAFIPWIWPLFDRIFRQVYLGPWIRRSNVLTGAEWMKTRFGTGTAGNLSHISVVVYALVLAVGFLCYAFQGIGKFAAVFFPWDLSWDPLLSAHSYAIIILLITTGYLLLGGWYSVVLTDLVQFLLLTIASVFIAWIAMSKVSAEMLQSVVPQGWDRLWLTWKLDLDWSGLIDGLNQKIQDDGYTFLGFIITVMFLKGILVSMAGPTPGYGIQHQLCTRSPREAALENWWMSIVQLVPRFLMITGIAVLGLAFFSSTVNGMLSEGRSFDFEQILPLVVRDYVPVGLVGVLMAGLLAAFMSTFDSTVNAGAAYVVNDVYKRYLAPQAPAKRYIHMSYLASIGLVIVSIVVGITVGSIHEITTWITFALYGGYVAPNVLKWHWWRFNGHGYFAGMLSGAFVAILIQLPKTINGFAGTELWEFPGRYAFFVTAPLSAIVSIVVCLATKPEEDEVLLSFYRNVRPWGFWGPIRAKLRQQDPDFEPNPDFWWDVFNVGIGIVWQLQLMVAPICLVIRRWHTFWGSLVVLAVTSVIMKFTWYDRLERS